MNLLNPHTGVKFTAPHKLLLVLLAVLWTTGTSCSGNEEKEAMAFETLKAEQTGLQFSNTLKATPAFNMFKYMYFYNGAGVGAGDFNNDGRVDLFFASNQGVSSLYLNEGGMKFRDVTTAAGVPNDGGWTTGVSVVDINNDGLLDIYLCRVGNYENLKSANLLLVCKSISPAGIPVYQEEAEAWGLRFSGFSTQAAFFDMDLDGDLDCYLMNHSLRFNGTFSPRATYQNTYDSLAGDRLFRNEGNRFKDITKASGINSSIIGYGLGIVVSDIDLDGYPDLYIGNDFHENDYLYLNQRDGRFKEVLNEQIMHTSQFSMGVDVADADNDGWPEIISMDMLPYDPYILKRSLGEDAYDIFNYKIGYGYNHQYARNNLQWNRRNGRFSEIGLYSGVYATDWSWAPLWMDFDNDGRKDLFISNGIPKRLNDIDYVNFASNEELQQKIRENRLEEKDMTLVNTFPEIKLPNQFFSNKGGLSFQKIQTGIGNDLPTFSNGAAYADLDNDGDLDIIVNNIDDPVLVYRNTANDKQQAPSVSLQLKGAPGNRNAVGAKLILYTKGEVRTYEKFPVRGFQSSMEIPLSIGLKDTKPDSVLLIWPDRSYQKIAITETATLTITYTPGLPLFDFVQFRRQTAGATPPLVTDIGPAIQLDPMHEENPFVEFDREPLIPHMISREGPALAVGDMNRDGLDDVFLGSAKTFKPGLYLQTASGTFQRSVQPELESDSMFEEADAVWADVNNDTWPDLVTASGGNEYYGEDIHLSPRIFLNDGKGQLHQKPDAFTNLYLTASCVLPNDFNGDGAVDLFIGGRAVPWEYGEIPHSYLLQNDGTGRFTDVTAKYAADLALTGFVTGAAWVDIDGDKDADLVLSQEWGPMVAFVNEKGRFQRKEIAPQRGWWQFVQPMDIDKDGDQDLVAGNLGRNSRLVASKEKPVRLYYADFDGNGKKEQLLTYYLDNKELVFANKDELQKQLPILKKKFLYAADFAMASLPELVGEAALRSATVHTADYFSNAVFINDGKGNFTLTPMPMAAQLSPYRAALWVEGSGILCLGNFYGANIQMGRYDADQGTLLQYSAGAGFAPPVPLGLKGEIRKAAKIRIKGQEAIVLARNNDRLQVIRLGQ